MAQKIGNVAVGTTLHLKESGVYQDYLVVNQGRPSSMYDASCNGTWLVRLNLIAKRAWDSGNSNKLETSDIQQWLNSDMLGNMTRISKGLLNKLKFPIERTEVWAELTRVEQTV